MASSEPAEARERDAAIAMRLRKIGPRGERLVVARERLLEPALAFEDDAEIHMRFGVIGLERRGARIMDGCLVAPAERRLREAHIEMRRRLRLIQRDRLADQLDRFGMAAPVMRDDAEPVPGCGMVAVELEDAHAKGLGF